MNINIVVPYSLVSPQNDVGAVGTEMNTNIVVRITSCKLEKGFHLILFKPRRDDVLSPSAVST